MINDKQPGADGRRYDQSGGKSSGWNIFFAENKQANNPTNKQTTQQTNKQTKRKNKAKKQN